jgi:hypothetical protein
MFHQRRFEHYKFRKLANPFFVAEEVVQNSLILPLISEMKKHEDAKADLQPGNTRKGVDDLANLYICKIRTRVSGPNLPKKKA